MASSKSGLFPVLALLMLIATVAGLFAAYKRFHVEASNRRVEIAVEWPEVVTLAQSSAHTIPQVLDAFKQQHVTTVVIAEDTITTLEQTGAVRPLRGVLPTASAPTFQNLTIVEVGTKLDIGRIQTALALRGLAPSLVTGAPPPDTRTVFEWAEPVRPGQVPGANALPPASLHLTTSADYASLRTMGLGLPWDAVEAVKAADLQIAGRIGNFPGVTPDSALSALVALKEVGGASTVIFNGEEVLGYRGLEPEVGAILRGEGGVPAARLPTYGAVEFGKQKGDEKLTAAVKGELVRVHSIQAAEMGQMEEDEAIDRFVRAAKERNIRFCYVRLATFVGAAPEIPLGQPGARAARPDALATNVQFLSKIASGMANGNIATGGGMGFGPARRFTDPGVPSLIFGLIALGAAAGTVWMIRAIATLPFRLEAALLVVLCLVCVGAAIGKDETGRKLVAFLAGVVFPATACILGYPGRSRARQCESDELSAARPEPARSPMASLAAAIRHLGIASLITAIGIVQVVGLLASRSFMLHSNQFLGIKAQHAVPVLIVALVALAGGVVTGERWGDFRSRAALKLREAMNEPARFGMLALALMALAGFMLVVARTGNDAGVGVSGVELKVRSVLDRVLPVRPRTKEFLVGHPAFVLALAWWWRGRKRLAIPAFVVGSLGQVSLLNTFCHIHTPLVVSLWRDGLGLLFGTVIGAALFLVLEAMFLATSRSSKTIR